MDIEKTRFLLIEEFKAFLALIEQKGLPFTAPWSDDEIKEMELSDLKRLVSIARDLARTPSSQ
jgi:hypothetical protein